MRDWYKMLKKLILVFVAFQIAERVLKKKKNADKESKVATKTETERLVLTPMSTDELTELIKVTQENDAELAAAYTDMLNGCKEKTDCFLWYTAWKITEKETGKMAGDICFKGYPENGCPEIGYGIIEAFRGRGYATEAVKAMCDWAFAQNGVKAIEAETLPDNEASKRVLQKCGFVPTGTNGEEGPRFIKNRTSD